MSTPNVILADGIAWMCVPKAASTSIKHDIRKALGLPPVGDVEVHHVWDYVAPEEIPEGYVKVCVVRNPFNRVASAFKYPGPGIVFQIHWDDYVDRLCLIPDEDINVHLKSNWWFERGFADEIWDVSQLDIPVSNSNDWDMAYTNEQQDMIRERYKQDFTQYGYLWE